MLVVHLHLVVYLVQMAEALEKLIQMEALLVAEALEVVAMEVPEDEDINLEVEVHGMLKDVLIMYLMEVMVVHGVVEAVVNGTEETVELMVVAEDLALGKQILVVLYMEVPEWVEHMAAVEEAPVVYLLLEVHMEVMAVLMK